MQVILPGPLPIKFTQAAHESARLEKASAPAAKGIFW